MKSPSKPPESRSVTNKTLSPKEQATKLNEADILLKANLIPPGRYINVIRALGLSYDEAWARYRQIAVGGD